MTQHYKIDNQIYEIPDDATFGDIQNHLSNSDNLSEPKTFSQKYQDFWNSQKPNPNDTRDKDVENTIIGRMHKNMPEFTPGTNEFNNQLEDVISSSVGAGNGMKILGDEFRSEPGQSIMLKGANALKNLFSNAFTNMQPYKAAVEKATQGAEEASKEAKIPKSGLYENPQTKLENVEDEIGKYINAEADHRARAGSQLTSRVKDIYSYWSDAYKKFEDKIKDVKFQMPEIKSAPSNLNLSDQDILTRIIQGADPKKVLQEEKNPYFEHLISQAPTVQDTSAKDFLAKYRDFRDAMGGLKEDLKSPNNNSIEKKKISDAIQKGLQWESQIKDTLTSGLGEHKPEFDWLMKGYSEHVFPLRRNPVVKAAKEGTLSNNIIDQISTNQSGMPLVRELVKQDPELLKNVIGQKYIASPGEVHAPNERMREYLDEVPEFKDMLDRREDVLQNAVKSENISLKNKIDAEKKYREIKNAKSKAKSKLWLGGIGTASVLGVPYGYSKISKMLGE